jgi:DNA-binding SARP family transcriptional activator
VERVISMRKALALAAYLAVMGRPHSRAHLVALFWPAADAAHGLLNLRQTLQRLRQAPTPRPICARRVIWRVSISAMRFWCRLLQDAAESITR